jgi:hypothetical protein
MMIAGAHGLGQTITVDPTAYQAALASTIAPLCSSITVPSGTQGPFNCVGSQQDITYLPAGASPTAAQAAANQQAMNIVNAAASSIPSVPADSTGSCPAGYVADATGNCSSTDCGLGWEYQNGVCVETNSILAWIGANPAIVIVALMLLMAGGGGGGGGRR